MINVVNNVVGIRTECPICGESDVIDVNLQSYKDWCAGLKLAQDAFPSHSPSERERLITGICDPCWDKSFGEEG